MTLLIDLAIIATVAFCGWRGFKNGLIRGVFGVVTLIASLFIASIAASAYSEEFTDILNPFIGGIIDSALIERTEEDPEAEPGTEAAETDDEDAEEEEEARRVIEVDLSKYEDESELFITAYSALRRIGLPEGSAVRVAELTEEESEDGEIPALSVSSVIADKLSSTVAFAAVFGIAFILLAIVFAVIGNLVGMVFSLPGLRLLDMISGAAFGVVKGLIIVYALATIARYLGVFAPELLNDTAILKFLINNNPIANGLGI